MNKLIYLLLVTLICCAVFVSYKIDSIKIERSEMFSSVQTSLWASVNEYRIRNGLNPLTLDQRMCNYADKRLGEIKDDWSHNGFNSDISKGYLFSTLCIGCNVMGENLARDFFNEKDILNGWINSPSHKENLDRKEYKFGCIKSGESNRTWYTVMEFGG
jgi:uncharacterized protein YkwD